MPKCPECGKVLKNAFAMKIHVGRMHKTGKAPKARKVAKPVVGLDINALSVDALVALKKQIDGRLAKMADQLRAAGVVGGKPGRKPGRNARVPVAKAAPKVKGQKMTGRPLAQYVHEVLSATEKGLSLKEIEARVLAAGYPTTAKSIYKQVTAVVTKGFKRVERGVYAVGAAVVKAEKKMAKAAKAPAAKQAVAPVAKATPPKKKPKKRGHFKENAEQFILGLLKAKGATTAEVNKAWKAAGRGATASPNLSVLSKAKKLKREPLKGEKGFLYTLA